LGAEAAGSIMSTTVALSNPLHTAIVPQWGQREMETEKKRRSRERWEGARKHWR